MCKEDILEEFLESVKNGTKTDDALELFSIDEMLKMIDNKIERLENLEREKVLKKEHEDSLKND